MLAISLINLAANLLFDAAVPFWALLPIAIFAFGWALMVPVVTLLVLDLEPERRGMASSLQAFIGCTANGIVAGVIAPLVMHSTVGAGADVAGDDEHRPGGLDLGQAAPLSCTSRRRACQRWRSRPQQFRRRKLQQPGPQCHEGQHRAEGAPVHLGPQARTWRHA